MITICTPTRGRPEQFKAFAEAIWNTTTNKDNVEIVVYRDDDDTSEYTYPDNCRVITSKRIYPDAAYEECRKVGKGPIYIYSPDDMMFLTPGWDIQMQEAFDKSDDKIIFAYFNDGHFRSSYGSVGAVHQNWIDAVGFFFDPNVVRGGDITINRLAKSLNRLVFLRGARITDLRINDAIHNEMAKMIEGAGSGRQRRAPESRARIKEAYNKLKQFIETYEKNNSTIN